MRLGRKNTKTRKKEIIETTLKLISEKGVRELKTARIAQKIGFSEAALYRHFSSKEEIISKTIETAGNRLLKTLSEAEEETKNEDPMGKMKNIIRAHLEFVEKNPGVTRLLFSDEIHLNKKSLREKLLNIVDECLSFIKNLLEEGKKTGQIRKDVDIETASIFYIGLIQSQVLLWSLSGGKRSLSEKIEGLWEHYRKLIEK